MPAHLDEPKNAAKRSAFLANGGTEAHITGNNGADVLAGEGALRFPVPPLFAFLAQQRRRLTMTTQDMYTTIWIQYVQDNSHDGILATANATDMSDIAELDAHDMPHEEEDDSDGEDMVDLHGNDIVKIPKIAIPQLHHDDKIVISYLQQAFANSPFVNSRRCENLKVVPINEIEYTALPTTSFIAYDDKGIKYKSHFRRIHWDVYLNFFQRIRWSIADDTNDHDISKQHKITYAELAIMVAIFSNGVTSDGYDLETCTKRVRYAHSKFYKCGVHINDGTDVVAYKTFFQPHGQINSLEDIGYKLPGIHRRPAVHEMHPAYFDRVATAIWRTCCSNAGNSFGRGVLIPRSSSLNIWVPCPLHETYRIIADRKEASDNNPDTGNDMECSFCALDIIEESIETERDCKWYRLLTFRRQLGNCIHDIPTAPIRVATETRNTGKHITNVVATDANICDITTEETNVQRISRLAKAIVNRQRNTRTGPCHICHSTSTAAKFWHASPISNPWPGIAADSALCQRCFQIFYRSVKRGVKPIFADIHGRPPD